MLITDSNDLFVEIMHEISRYTSAVEKIRKFIDANILPALTLAREDNQ